LFKTYRAPVVLAMVLTLGSGAAYAVPERVAHHGPEGKPSMPDWMKLESSIKLTHEQMMAARQAAQEAIQKSLQKYARISPKQAEEAAAKAVPGSVARQSGLRFVRDNLVYFVWLEKDQKSDLAVVDAGNGNVLLVRPMMKAHEARG
jgi:hypothetical protein